MTDKPLDMVLHCPKCHTQHIDKNEFEDRIVGRVLVWENKPHRSHLCANCRTIWRPADVPTNGVERVTTRGSADTWPAIDGAVN